MKKVLILFLMIFHSYARAVPLRYKRAFSYIANETACTVDHIVYKDGDPIPTDDPCESCKCRPPGFSCVLRECEVKTGCKAIRREGECCPEYQCGCEHNGNYYRDGDRIPNAESPCYSCYCQGSSITCSLADCKFRFDCEPEYVLGECCPRYDHCPPEPGDTSITVKSTVIPLLTTLFTKSTTTSIVTTTAIPTTTTTPSTTIASTPSSTTTPSTTSPTPSPTTSPTPSPTISPTTTPTTTPIPSPTSPTTPSSSYPDAPSTTSSSISPSTTLLWNTPFIAKSQTTTISSTIKIETTENNKIFETTETNQVNLATDQKTGTTISNQADIEEIEVKVGIDSNPTTLTKLSPETTRNSLLTSTQSASEVLTVNTNSLENNENLNSRDIITTELNKLTTILDSTERNNSEFSVTTEMPTMTMLSTTTLPINPKIDTTENYKTTENPKLFETTLISKENSITNDVMMTSTQNSFETEVPEEIFKDSKITTIIPDEIIELNLTSTQSPTDITSGINENSNKFETRSDLINNETEFNATEAMITTTENPEILEITEISSDHISSDQISSEANDLKITRTNNLNSTDLDITEDLNNQSNSFGFTTNSSLKIINESILTSTKSSVEELNVNTAAEVVTTVSEENLNFTELNRFEATVVSKTGNETDISSTVETQSSIDIIDYTTISDTEFSLTTPKEELTELNSYNYSVTDSALSLATNRFTTNQSASDKPQELSTSRTLTNKYSKPFDSVNIFVTTTPVTTVNNSYFSTLTTDDNLLSITESETESV